MKEARFVPSLIALLTCTNGASAWLFDNFESYANQAQFQAAWPSFALNGTSLILVQDFGYSSAHSVRGVVPSNRQYFNYRNLDSFTQYNAANGVTFEIHLYDSDITQPGSYGARNFVSLYAYDEADGSEGMPPYAGAPTKNQQAVVSLGLCETYTRTGYYAFRLLYGGLNKWYATDTPRSVGWHDMKMVMDTAGASVYVDGVLDAYVGWSYGTRHNFDGVVLGSGLTSCGYDVTFDDIRVTPEPATLLLLVVGRLMLGRRRRAV